MKLFLVLLEAIIFTSCVSAPVIKPAAPPSQGVPQPVESDDDQVVVSIPGFKDSWSAKFVQAMSPLKPKFDKASADMARFCPNYSKLSAHDQIQAWGYLVSGVVKFESDYDPTDEYEESDGEVSQGLLQLTYGNAHCPSSQSQGDLNDPLINLNCGIQIMADEISEDSVVAAGGYTANGAPPARGAARYWSTLRVPDSKNKHDLADIIAMTKKAPGCS